MAVQKDNSYYPSIWRVGKFGRYFSYLWEYVRWGDFNSLAASLKFIFFHRPTNKSWISRSEMGTFKIRPNTTDFQYVNYTYERAVRNYLEKQMPTMRHFIDVGACIGEYSIWLGKKGISCIAFEPVNYAATEENIRLNNASAQVKLYKCGLGEEKAKVYFNVLPTLTGSSSIDRSKSTNGGNINIDTLDNVLADFAPKEDELVVVKLDVESMEKEVIAGGANFLRRIKNLHIIFEKFPGSSDEIEEALGHHAKFKSFRIDEANAVSIKIGDI
jgi:FkbM family methyltransferase